MLDILVWLGIWIILLIIGLLFVFIKRLRKCWNVFKLPVTEFISSSNDPIASYSKVQDPIEAVTNDKPQYVRNDNRRRNICIVISGISTIGLLVSYLLGATIFAIYVGVAQDGLAFPAVSADDCRTESCPVHDLNCCSYSSSSIPTDWNWEDVTFNVTIGGKVVRLNGWYMENTTAASGEQTWLNVLYNHGSGQNVAVQYRKQRYAYLLSLGRIRLFSYDYPGYGKSDGSPSASSVKQSSHSALQWFRERTAAAFEKTSYQNITLLGRSLGGGVAVWLANQIENESPNESIKAMILQSTFTTYADAAAAPYPVYGWVIKSVWSNHFNSIDNIRSFDGCLYESHSKDDEWVPYSEGQELFAAASNVPTDEEKCKVFISVSDVKHDDPMTDKEKQQLRIWTDINRERTV